MAMKRNKKGTSAGKRFSQKRSLNAGRVKRSTAGDIFDRDVKRRIGQYSGAGEPHMSRKGSVGRHT